MNAHNEQQARQLLALGLDEFGHHTEAANVRQGIDLDDYKVDLWAIRAALDAQPAAAQEAVAYCQPDDPLNSSAFSWPGTDRKPSHTTPLYAAPVTAAPANDLHAHLLHMLGAKDHEDAGRIIGELHAAVSTPAAPGIDLATAWAEGYRSGVTDERISESNIGIAGFGAKIEPARANPYMIDASHKGGSDTARLDALEELVDGCGGALLLHHGCGNDHGFYGLGLRNTGRSLRQAIDATMQPQAGDAEVRG